MPVAPPRTDADVPAFLEALGLPGLIDLHVHFLPERMQQKVWAWFDNADIEGLPPWSVQYREDVPTRLERLRAMRVKAFPSLVYPHKAGMSEWLNGWAADFAQSVPECLQTGTFYPEPEADRYVAEAIENGTRIFKVHIGVGDYDPRDPLLAPVWRRLAETGVPVVVHCGSGPNPGRWTGPGPFGEVMDANPELVALIAHMGGPEYADFLDLALRYPNIHLDTSVAFTEFFVKFSPYPSELLDRLAAHPERITFGTDFPTIPHAYAHQLEALVNLGMGDDWLRAVCWDNGMRLMGLDL
jgi:predicted TIM-barrel fold metal-dependent hydrolase